MVDHKTIDVYNAKVNEYSQMGGFTTNKHLKDFVKLQKRNNLVLDLGCGHGAAASYMIKEGLKCYAVDASSKMVKLANRKFNIGAEVCTFEELNPELRFNGVYASFSLLHINRNDFFKTLLKIENMLLADGCLGLGMKLGSGSKRDTIGRFYSYYSENELVTSLENINLNIISRYSGRSKGLAGDVEPWLFLIGQKKL
jgi:ubiquinone/menaquinone biosynthesis C-methylase UbiE